ncbi:Oidioi.mRNA.OKI2018_I69.chr2.g6404.t1.cds [Oikopleura dioica]|uniref:Oidioi.mRNA.OKI2018_I69.chr2.g6404.t1.cds n=1 Tax=Oikopleura dioica TaxID=34765 RepID=A0ABN7T3W7_OIKDI|nr:Oidioi.mRNA.OKI2018_I69.chr2.g6404.t1.cds [Oikopleura dioica]
MNPNGLKSKSKKKKSKPRKPKPSLWQRDGALKFISSGLDTEQSREDFLKRERKRQFPNESDDCFVDDSSDEELEITELAHKDSEDSGVLWGVKANKIMQKMGWKRGEGLGKMLPEFGIRSLRI